MAFTYGEAKLLLSRWAGRGGKCPDAVEVDLFVKQVMQYMLISGSAGNLRTFCFNAIKGCFTIPYELEVPLKVKIDGEVGTVWDRWFQYYNIGEMEGCTPASNALYEEPNRFPTVYDLPQGGSKVGVLGTCTESPDAHVIVQGIDTSGREVVTNHKGEQIVGEYLSITEGQLRYTQVTFGKITGIVKTATKGYCQLYWIKTNPNSKGYLSDYSPLETIPQYRRFRLTSPKCGHSVKVSVLGRIRIKDNYADSDIIPFDNIYALSVAAQSINAQYNDNTNIAQVKDAHMQDLITRESEYKRVENGQPIDIFFGTSAGLIKNINGW